MYLSVYCNALLQLAPPAGGLVDVLAVLVLVAVVELALGLDPALLVQRDVPRVGVDLVQVDFVEVDFVEVVLVECDRDDVDFVDMDLVEVDLVEVLLGEPV